MEKESVGFWRHTRLSIQCAFTEFKIVRDVLIGTAVAVMTLGLQVWKHLIPVTDWQEHKSWWVLSFLLPYLGVLSLDAVWRFVKSPWMLFAKTVKEHLQEIATLKGEHAKELAEARKPAQQKLVVHSARYGTGDVDDVSVLDAINRIPRDGLVVPVDNNLVAGRPDPAPNQPKRLRVEFSYGDSSPRVVERPESQPGAPSRLVIPEDTAILWLGQALQTVKEAANSAEQGRLKLQTALSDSDNKHREEMAALAKKVEESTRDWPGDWKLAEDGFRRYEPYGIRADYFRDSSVPLETWNMAGGLRDKVRDCEALCMQAGRLLMVSPMSAHISADLQAIESDVDRWLYYLKSRYGIEDTRTGQTTRDGKTFAIWGGSIHNLAGTSARACIECGAKSFATKTRSA